MPDHLKNTPESVEFNSYLKSFINRKEKEHRRKVISEAATTISLMLAG